MYRAYRWQFAKDIEASDQLPQEPHQVLELSSGESASLWARTALLSSVICPTVWGTYRCTNTCDILWTNRIHCAVPQWFSPLCHSIYMLKSLNSSGTIKHGSEYHATSNVDLLIKSTKLGGRLFRVAIVTLPFHVFMSALLGALVATPIHNFIGNAKSHWVWSVEIQKIVTIFQKI